MPVKYFDGSQWVTLDATTIQHYDGSAFNDITDVMVYQSGSWQSVLGSGDGGSTTVPTAEGIHEWLMDEGTGTTAADRVASADLTLTNTNWVSGVGVNDYVIGLNGTDAETMAAAADLNDWTDSGGFMMQFYPRDTSTADQRLVWHYPDGDNNRLFARLFTSPTEIEIGMAASNNLTDHGVSDSAINGNAWNGIGFFWDSGSYDFHIYDYSTGSITTGSGTYSGTMAQSGDLYLGSGNGANFTDARVDFPRVFDSYYTPTEAESKFDEISGFY